MSRLESPLAAGDVVPLSTPKKDLFQNQARTEIKLAPGQGGLRARAQPQQNRALAGKVRVRVQVWVAVSGSVARWLGGAAGEPKESDPHDREGRGGPRATRRTNLVNWVFSRSLRY